MKFLSNWREDIFMEDNWGTKVIGLLLKKLVESWKMTCNPKHLQKIYNLRARNIHNLKYVNHLYSLAKKLVYENCVVVIIKLVVVDWIGIL